MDPLVVALTFGAIFVVELPDKTFLATLVLSTKYRPILVWIGVGAAFAVQTMVAVLLGHAASFLPDDRRAVRRPGDVPGRRGRPVPRGPQPPAGVRGGVRRQGRGRHRASGRCWRRFLVLFAAEWGDLSQLLTISLVARTTHPVSVFVGALGALLVVSGLAVLAGRALLRCGRRCTSCTTSAPAVCLLLAALTVYELRRADGREFPLG